MKTVVERATNAQNCVNKKRKGKNNISMQARTWTHTWCFHTHCLRNQKWHSALHFPVSTFTENRKKNKLSVNKWANSSYSHHHSIPKIKHQKEQKKINGYWFPLDRVRTQYTYRWHIPLVLTSTRSKENEVTYVFQRKNSTDSENLTAHVRANSYHIELTPAVRQQEHRIKLCWRHGRIKLRQCCVQHSNHTLQRDTKGTNIESAEVVEMTKSVLC